MEYQEGGMPLKGTVTSLEGTASMTLSQEHDTRHRGDSWSLGGVRKGSFSWEKSMWQKPLELTYRQQGRERNVQYWPPRPGLGELTFGGIEGRAEKAISRSKGLNCWPHDQQQYFFSRKFYKMKAIKVNPGDQRMRLTWINEVLPRQWGLFISSEKLEEEEGWQRRV